jgi:hypothetical protein
MTYNIENPGPDLESHKNVAELNRLMGCKPFPFDYWLSNGNTYIN